MRRTTLRVEVVASKYDNYSKIVFKNLDEEQKSENRYIMATKCPNWEGYSPRKGDVGFVEIEWVNAGDNYIDPNMSTNQYRYTACYFLNFIKEEISNNNKEYKF